MSDDLELIVVGGGEGFYKNLQTSLQSTRPDLTGMRVTTLIDIKPEGELHPETRAMIARQGIRYVQITSEGVCPLPTDPGPRTAGIVMTPNDTHLYYARLFAIAGIPVNIEKPATTSMQGLTQLLRLAQQHPKLIYASEYCTDGKCLPLLAAAGMLGKAGDNDPRLSYVKVRSMDNDNRIIRVEFRKFFRNLGLIQSVHGIYMDV